MIDFSLTDEQAMLREEARAFAAGEIAPAAAAIRREPGRNPWEIVRPVYAKAAGLGFARLLIPDAYGGLGLGAIEHALVMEEFGAVDHGIAASWFNVSMTAVKVLEFGGTEAQRQRWLTAIAQADDYVLASASSEPDVAGADSFCPYPDPSIGLRTAARREGDGYVLSGRKAGFSTNAGAARAYFIMARTDLSRPARESTSMFIVPADAPGLSVGGRTKLIGWHGATHAEVLLDDVHVGLDARIGAEGANTGLFFFKTLPFLAGGLAATYVGLARAAFELAWRYAHDRRSWGEPIIAHQAVRLRLADMAAAIEGARLAVWHLAWAADRGDPQAPAILSPIAKTTAVEAAKFCASNAVSILGGYGAAADYPAGGMLADAWIGDSCDGTRDMLRLAITDGLKMLRDGLPPYPGGGAPPLAGGNGGHAESMGQVAPDAL